MTVTAHGRGFFIWVVDNLIEVGYDIQALKIGGVPVFYLAFRTGFPEKYMGQYKLYIFEIMLNDGTKRHAVVDQTMCGDIEDLHWKDPKTGIVIPVSSVAGWRETYKCDEAKQDIDAYFKDSISIVAKDHLGDAFRRHIDREPCESCLGYYEAKSTPAKMG